MTNTILYAGAIIRFFFFIGQLGCSSHFLKFADQTKPPIPRATNYAVLKSDPDTKKLSKDGFSICSSIYIGYFRGHQAFYTLRRENEAVLWFSLYINGHDLVSEAYTSIFAYFGDSLLSSSKQLKLRPHDWSHACTSLNRTSRQVLVVINGVVTHDQILDIDEFWESLPPLLQDNLVVGVAEWQYELNNQKTTQSEASVANLNVFKIALKKTEMVDLTSNALCSAKGDYLSWSEAEWRFVGEVKTQPDVDFCLHPEIFPNLYFFPEHLFSWAGCLSLCPRIQESGRFPAVRDLPHSQQLVKQFRNLSEDFARNPQDPHWLFSSFRHNAKGGFVDHYSEQAMPEGLWVRGQPNGGAGQPCTAWMGQRDDGRLFDTTCQWQTFGQCLCQFESSPIVRLRGLCASSNIDTHFALKVSNKRITFKGLKGSEIRLLTVDNLPQWTIQTIEKTTTATSSAPDITYAMGKNSWKIVNDSLKCNEGKLTEVKLKISSCKDGAFTCNNGDCVKMEERCDQVFGKNLSIINHQS